MKLYAAYGSNLNIEQMGGRCPSASVVGTGVLKDYRLLFKGSQTGAYLTIEKSKGSTVPVGLWRITEAHERDLDRYEGFPRFYHKETLTADCGGGRKLNCLVYVMNENRSIALPSLSYFFICRQGYDDFGFDIKYLNEAYKYSARRKTL